jgi:suppressor of ftsI
VEHVLVPPAGRVEAIVTGPNVNAHATLRTLCVDTGAQGDPNPAMILADLRAGPSTAPSSQGIDQKLAPPEYQTIDLSAYQNSPPAFTVVFTEDKNGFYINDQKYEPNAAPMTPGARGHIPALADSE